jgi:hypothetical protein
VSSLNSNRQILCLARDLGLSGLEGPVEQITEYCVQRIEAISSRLNINSLAELEQVVARSLNLQIEEIWSDADVEKIVQKYAVSEGDFIFATVRTHFNADTFGTTFLRKKTSPSEANRYVAVIDCRGEAVSFWPRCWPRLQIAWASLQASGTQTRSIGWSNS